MPFRANDAVRVIIGDAEDEQDWILGADEHEGFVISSQRTEDRARASACVLARATTDDGRLAMLRQMAAEGGERGRWARRDLATAGIDAPPERQRSLFA